MLKIKYLIVGQKKPFSKNEILEKVSGLCKKSIKVLRPLFIT